ncbi:uncharacterized protein METZ01_LOCUS251342, partial [marine metagenome]
MKLINSIFKGRPNWFAAVVVAALTGCGDGRTGEPGTGGSAEYSSGGKVKVTTTVNMVGDLVREVGGNHVEVSE